MFQIIKQTDQAIDIGTIVDTVDYSESEAQRLLDQMHGIWTGPTS
jgi:hypothetical protein